MIEGRGGVTQRDVDNVGNDGAGGGHHTCAAAIEDNFADGVAENADSVEGAVDLCETIILIYKGRVDAEGSVR